MSQPRMRKANNTPGEVPRVRSTFVKASGDTSINPNRQKHPRSRSKNKIPKNIRYDLDNALVGLCDVWFEDIKPHLIRNHIKVHIHGAGASPASGDHQRPSPAGCSHQDPGAASDRHPPQCVNFADCCLTRRTASRARCRRPPTPEGLSRPLSPIQLILQSLNVPPICNENEKVYRKRKARHQKKPSQTQPAPYQSRQSRISHTYCVFPTELPPISRTRNIRSALPHYRTRDKGSQTYIKILIDTASINMVDKATQTNQPSLSARRNTNARVSIPAASFDRCAGKTTLLPSRSTPHPPCTLPKTLSSDIFQTHEKVKGPNNKQIEVLYQSPLSSRFNSSITMLEMPKGRRKRKNAGKIPPWR